MGVGIFFCGGGHLQPRGRVLWSFCTTTGDVWIIPYLLIWGYVQHVDHVGCVITNCGQHKWVIPSLSIALQAMLEKSITRKLLSPFLDMFFKMLPFLVHFLVFFFIAIVSLYFLLVGLFLQYVSVSVRELVKYLCRCKLMYSYRLQWQVNLMGTLPFCVFFAFIFKKLIKVITWTLLSEKRLSNLITHSLMLYM